jgi:preprotein translocase subunit Sss1
MDEIITSKISRIRSKLSQVSDESREVLSEVVDLIEYLATADKIVPTVKVPTIDEFIKKAKLKKHSDKVLCIAYFLEEYKRLESFTVKDIDGAYKMARLVPPKNLSDSILKLKERGLLIEIDKKKKLKFWRLSADGIIHVKSFLDEKNVI